MLQREQGEEKAVLQSSDTIIYKIDVPANRSVTLWVLAIEDFLMHV